MTFAARLKMFRTAAGLTQEQLAHACGWSGQSRIANYESTAPKARQPKPDEVVLIASALKISVSELLEESTKTPVLPTETPDGYVRFPLLDGFVAAGDGGYMPDYPEVVREISVAKEWAQRNLAAPHGRIRVVTAQGDSMQPEIGSGDVLFVDSGVTFYDTDAVYVMNWQGRPIVKRLQMRRDGTLLIKSANPSYESEVVPVGEVDQLFITGRVIGVWQFRAH